MGSFSIFHWVIVLIIPGFFVLIGLIIWLIVRASRARPSVANFAVPPTVTASSQTSAASRLQELSALKSKGLITDAEYEQQRSAILSSV